MVSKIRLLAVIGLLFAALGTLANTPPLDKNEWEKATRNLDYTEEKEEIPSEEISFNSPSNLKYQDLIETIFKFVFFCAIAWLIVYFLRALVKPKKTHSKPNIGYNTIQEAEENLPETDLRPLIENLIKTEAYRDAARGYFLLILQELNTKNAIVWEKQKTNFDYVNEVEDEPFYASFAAITQKFERIWYGKNSLNKIEFETLEKSFKNFLNTVANA